MTSTLKGSRSIAFHRQSGHCCYCGLLMWLDTPSNFAARYGLSSRQARELQCTGEHRVAKCDGGSATTDNIDAACLCCNRRRHQRAVSLDATDYANMVRKRMLAKGWHPQWLLDRLPPPCFPR